MGTKEAILKKLHDSVINYNIEECIATANEGIDAGIDPVELIQEGLTPAILEVGDKFGSGEISLPLLMVSAETMQAAMEILMKSLKESGKQYKHKATMVIGTVQGDIHDLGVSIVSAVFEAAGIRVINLGKDVPAQKFIDAAEEYNANIIGTSALLSGTMFQQKVVIEKLKKQGLRNKYIYLIGGGAMPSGDWCEEIGADGWATDVMDALEIARKCLLEKGIEL
ncbi:MAG: cobalamin B12-binding domain-containing protein [Candidatus Helarchaeota archaeon]